MAWHQRRMCPCLSGTQPKGAGRSYIFPLCAKELYQLFATLGPAEGWKWLRQYLGEAVPLTAAIPDGVHLGTSLGKSKVLPATSKEHCYFLRYQISHPLPWPLTESRHC